MLKKIIPVTIAAIGLAAGCSQKTATTTPPPSTSTAPAASTTPSTGADFKVALLTTGPITDGGWDQSAYNGLLKIQKDLGATVAHQENVQQSQIADAFRDFANRGFNLIIGNGDEYGPAAAKVAKEFPNVDFVTNGSDKSGPNLTPIHFATEEGQYLQGMEAGFISKSGKGGFVGGKENGPVKQAVDAFRDGTIAANPKFNFNVAYINSWNDPAAAKSQTLTFLSNGVDVVAHNCDAAATGMFQAAGTQKGVYTFGVNADQNNMAPNVFSSTALDIPAAFTAIATRVKNKTFKGGPISLGMASGAVTLVDNPKFTGVLTADQKAKIDAAEKDMVAGKIKL